MPTTTDWISAISTLILVMATGIYVYFTIKRAKETTKPREAETSPLITLFESKTIELFNKHGLHPPNLKTNYLASGIKQKHPMGQFGDILNTNLNFINITLDYKSFDNQIFYKVVEFNFDNLIKLEKL